MEMLLELLYIWKAAEPCCLV